MIRRMRIGARLALAVVAFAVACTCIAATPYAARRAALLKAVSGAPVILQADDASQAENLRYFTGIVAKDILVAISGDGAKAAVYARDDRLADARKATGLKDILPLSDCPQRLASIIRSAKEQVVYADEGWTNSVSGIVLPVSVSLKDLFPDLKFRNVYPIAATLRTIKDDEEIATIRKACQITSESLRTGMVTIKPGMNEGTLADTIRKKMLALGAEGPDFWITGSGTNSIILHYMDNKRDMQDGDLVLLDWGAVYKGYRSDITRTVPVNGKFTPRQREIYEVVLRAQEKAIALVKPGAKIGELTSAVDETLKAAGLEGKMGHGLSHHVGLNVHDPGPLDVLKPGMVFTIEPGVYLPEDGFGIRIEDTVLVTKTGCDVLTKDIPKSVTDIEALVGKEKG
jgi:Xaa-Pro aminopeptidase